MGDWVFIDGAPGSGVRYTAFESFDVRIRVAVDDPSVLRDVVALLPPHANPCPPESTTASFGIFSDPDGRYRFERDDSVVSRRLDLDFALTLMEAQLRIYVGLNTPGRMFVHAGVVEQGGAALVMPGLSFSGKTTLVAAFVEAGAGYYSDDYAVIDEAGLVHPFAKPLSIRDHDQVQSDHPVESFGGLAGEESVPIGAVIFTEYRPDARWRPTRLSHGRGVLKMLEHTLAARQRAREALRVFNGAIRGAVLLEGVRGEASEVVGPLLEMAEGGLAQALARDGR